MNRKERALHQINLATDWVIGGYVNAFSDGEIETMPEKQDIIYEIYDTILTSTVEPGCLIAKPMPDLKFCGRDWLIKKIKERVEEDPEYKIAP